MEAQWDVITLVGGYTVIGLLYLWLLGDKW